MPGAAPSVNVKLPSPFAMMLAIVCQVAGASEVVASTRLSSPGAPIQVRTTWSLGRVSTETIRKSNGDVTTVSVAALALCTNSHDNPGPGGGRVVFANAPDRAPPWMNVNESPS